MGIDLPCCTCEIPVALRVSLLGVALGGWSMIWIGRSDGAPEMCVKLLVFDRTYVHFGLSPLPVTVTTRIITFSVGDPELNLYLPLLLGRGHTQCIIDFIHSIILSLLSSLPWALFHFAV